MPYVLWLIAALKREGKLAAQVCMNFADRLFSQLVSPVLPAEG